MSILGDDSWLAEAGLGDLDLMKQVRGTDALDSLEGPVPAPPAPPTAEEPEEEEFQLTPLPKMPDWCRKLFHTEVGATMEDITVDSGWYEVLYGCLPEQELDEFFGQQGKQCFLFQGDYGVGSSTIAEAFGNSFLQYKGIFASVKGRHLDGADAHDMEQRVRQLFQVAEKGIPTCIKIDRLETSRDPELLKQLILEYAEDCGEEVPLHLIVILRSEEEVSSLWQSVFTVCRFQVPDEKERKRFFQDKRNHLPLCDLTDEKVVELTQGLNYNQLKKLVRLSRMWLKNRVFQDDKRYKNMQDVKIAVEIRELGITLNTFLKLVEQIKGPEKPGEPGEVQPPVQQIQLVLPEGFTPIITAPASTAAISNEPAQQGPKTIKLDSDNTIKEKSEEEIMELYLAEEEHPELRGKGVPDSFSPTVEDLRKSSGYFENLL